MLNLYDSRRFARYFRHRLSGAPQSADGPTMTPSGGNIGCHSAGCLTSESAATTIQQGAAFEDLLREFVDVNRPSQCMGLASLHDVQHYIFTGGPPVAESAYRLSPKKLKVAKAKFDFMLVEGIC